MDASIYDTDSFIKDFESCVNDQLKVFNVLVDSIQSFGVVPVKFLYYWCINSLKSSH